MKTRTKEKQIKEAWERIALKLPAVFPTRKERKAWVSKNSRAARKARRNPTNLEKALDAALKKDGVQK